MATIWELSYHTGSLFTDMLTKISHTVSIWHMHSNPDMVTSLCFSQNWYVNYEREHHVFPITNTKVSEEKACLWKQPAWLLLHTTQKQANSSWLVRTHCSRRRTDTWMHLWSNDWSWKWRKRLVPYRFLFFIYFLLFIEHIHKRSSVKVT